MKRMKQNNDQSCYPCFFFYLRIESEIGLKSICTGIELLSSILSDQMNNVALDTFGIKTKGNVKVCTIAAIAK